VTVPNPAKAADGKRTARPDLPLPDLARGAV